MSETSITITVKDTTITGDLQASAATTSLLAQLPLELTFEDFGGQEKIATLPAPLALDGMPSGSSAEPGTIGYYAPDQALVLYYDRSATTTASSPSARSTTSPPFTTHQPSGARWQRTEPPASDRSEAPHERLPTPIGSGRASIGDSPRNWPPSPMACSSTTSGTVPSSALATAA